MNKVEQEYETLRQQFNIPENISVFGIWHLNNKNNIPTIRLQGSNKVKLIEVFPNRKAFDKRIEEYSSYELHHNVLCEFNSISEALNSYDVEFLSYAPFDQFRSK